MDDDALYGHHHLFCYVGNDYIPDSPIIYSIGFSRLDFGCQMLGGIARMDGRVVLIIGS